MGSLIFLATIVVLLLIRLSAVMGIRPAKKNGFSSADENSNVIEVEATEVGSQESGEINNRYKSESIIICGRKFDKGLFLKGAEKALEAVDQAFNEGNESKLCRLLDGSILDSFLSSVQERNRRGEKLENLLLSIKKSEVLDVTCVDKKVKASVLFELEQTKILRNKNGEIIDGDADYVRTIKQVWQFEQPLSADFIQWKLTSISNSQ
ncbi:MAG: Tim44/TimA family putative adaptor protein [Holosporales bacterium]|jgi:predicted lipid-binding transport protein (Tim44 family)|nr:Tim44/TimA family putative adaptor protein [Holosporales bacterium]